MNSVEWYALKATIPTISTQTYTKGHSGID